MSVPCLLIAALGLLGAPAGARADFFGPQTNGVEIGFVTVGQPGNAIDRAGRRGAFELLHRAYLRAGLVVDNPAGLRVTLFHFEPTTELFVAVQDGTVVGTVTLVGDGRLGVPMASVYPEEMEQIGRSHV